MKKIFSLAVASLLITNVILADDDADKKFRFGLKVTPTPTWLRSQDKKVVESTGIKFGFGFGLQLEFRLNSTAHFVTGIGGDFLGGKQTFKNGQGYVLTKDNAYVNSTDQAIIWERTPLDMNTDAGTERKFYEIKSRDVKMTYVTLPVLLKLMTKDIGGFKYFGMFGGNIAIQTKYRATDEIVELQYNSTSNHFETAGTSTITDMRPKGDLIPFNVALNVGLGFEYNLSGSTSIFVGVNYIRGFINQYQSNSDIMVEKLKDNLNNSIRPATAKQSGFSDGVQLNIGFLF
ncbi:MAG: outer membrane beta-barrel protein [Bacteroidia bacterium]|nr:outer membrane beta-barrel protein [Bacteroidia bacterium]MBN8694806.1 outer membrane beta-barrel protein [Bacteroidota bacterium]